MSDRGNTAERFRKYNMATGARPALTICTKERSMSIPNCKLSCSILLVATVFVMGAHGPGSVHAAALDKPKVYFTKNINPEGMLKLYNLMNKDISGRVAVKVHTGEPNAPNILSRDLVKAVTDSIPGATIVETNTYYDSPRKTTQGHRKVIADNGWTFAPVDILDEEGSVNLTVPGGKWFKKIAMGSHTTNYDSLVVLTHFKGHSIGGFGGSLKNIAIGLASAPDGKKQMHSLDGDPFGAQSERFMEHMAESGKAIQTHFGRRMAYINVLNKMSVDCDCAGVSAEPPTVPDIGLVASPDLLAVDQASIDMIYALPEDQRAHLVERFESRSGLHQLKAMERLGMGSREYELVIID